jgi:hypothetical protein
MAETEEIASILRRGSSNADTSVWVQTGGAEI